MYPATNTTLWQYRRKKRRILGPVARGLIVGGLILGWIVYYSIFKQSSNLHDSENQVSPKLNTFKIDEDFSNLRNAFSKTAFRHGSSRSLLQASGALPGEKASKIFHDTVKEKKDSSDVEVSSAQMEQMEEKAYNSSNEESGKNMLEPNNIPIGKQGGFSGVIISKDENATDSEGECTCPSDPSGLCTDPAIDKFPNPLIGRKGRLYGGVLVYILAAMYMFIGLAIICDDYFVPALDRISEVLDMPPDVAGATFMAAGSSGPELATAVIGVFVAKDDIGISGVIGSAIFNITLVIAVCALAAEHVFYLSWWSVLRDCLTYLICIAVLLGTIANEQISWPEALLFLVLYVLYCVFMGFSSRIEAAIGDKIPVPQSWRNVQQGGVEADIPADERGATYKNVQGHMTAGSGGGGLVSNGMNGNVDIPLTPTEKIEMGMKKQNDDEPNKLEDPKVKPGPDAGKWAKFKWAITFPLYTLSSLTIPDCRKEKWANSFVLTFLMAIFWISIYSYLMVWMITVIGATFLIPDTVMGLTFIAAGVSVPDALAGIAVVKEGHGDMAVSNAIGSNVFDILVCLGLPWFISTAIYKPGSVVLVKSRGLLYSTFSLFSTVVFLIVACHFNHWKLDRKFGIILLVWYFIFMSIAAMYELNIFGEYNTQCFAASKYG